MRISLACDCGQPITVSQEAAGGSVICSRCGTKVAVPPLGRLEPSRPATPDRGPGRPRSLTPFLVAVALVMIVAAGIACWLVATDATNRSNRLSEAPSPPRTTSGGSDGAPSSRLANAVEQTTRDSTLKSEEQVASKRGDTPKSPEPSLPEPMPQRPVKPEPKPKPVPPSEETLRQELIVTQKPIFRIQGISQPSILQYRIVSVLKSRRGDADTLVAEQTIEQAELLQADPATRAVIGTTFARLPKKSLTFQFDSDRRVKKLDGWSEEGGLGPALGGQGLRMSSLLDRDGWKEMAEVTFFRPRNRQLGATWSAPLVHHWGSLGEWSGQVHYQRLPNKGELEAYRYTMQLGYKPPAKNATGLLQISNAQFQLQEVAGQILFDADRQRVVSAEERFHVRGGMLVNLLGVTTPAEVDEEQHFVLRVLP